MTAEVNVVVEQCEKDGKQGMRVKVAMLLEDANTIEAARLYVELQLISSNLLQQLERVENTRRTKRGVKDEKEKIKEIRSMGKNNSENTEKEIEHLPTL